LRLGLQSLGIQSIEAPGFSRGECQLSFQNNCDCSK